MEHQRWTWMEENNLQMGNIETQAGDYPWDERGDRLALLPWWWHVRWLWEVNTRLLCVCRGGSLLPLGQFAATFKTLQIWRDVCFIWGNLKVSLTFRCPRNPPVWFWVFQWMNGRARWPGNTNTHTSSFLISLTQRSPWIPVAGSLGMSPSWFCQGSGGILGGVFYQVSIFSQVHLDEIRPRRKRKSYWDRKHTHTTFEINWVF